MQRNGQRVICFSFPTMSFIISHLIFITLIVRNPKLKKELMLPMLSKVKFYPYRLVLILLVGSIIFCATPPLFLAADSRIDKKDQLPSPVVAPAEVHDSDYLQGRRFEDRFLNLGVDEKFTILERDLIKVQVKNFIPPLLVPAVGGHAFVLPPGLFQVATSFKFVNVEGEDFTKDGEIDLIHVDNTAQRRFLTTSLRYGFDLDKKFFHSFTAVLNVTYENSTSRGPVQLPHIGNGAKSVFNGGASEGIQDVNLMFKKKIWDQGNAPVGWAVAAGVYFPNGSTNKRAGDNGVISVTPKGGQKGGRPVFKRFTNDGTLPAGRQLGTGEMSYKVATFFTRQFLPGDLPDFLAGTPFDRAAIHWGGAYRFNAEHDGVNRGDLATIFGSIVIPVYKDYFSVQLSSISNWQEQDTYGGKFRFPNSEDTKDRPNFRGGWLSLVGPSIIFSPDPLVRFTATLLGRVVQPHKGPSPPYVANLGMSVTF